MIIFASEKVVPSFEQNLTICLQPQRLSCSLTSVRGDLLKLGEYPIADHPSMAEAMGQLKQALADWGVSPIGLNSSRVVVNADSFVWVPDSLYEAGKERQCLAAVCDIPAGASLLCDHNDLVQAQCIFACDSNWASAFKIVLPGVKLRCQHSLFANETTFAKSQGKNLMIVQVREGVSDFIVLSNKSFQMCNTFSADNIDEVVYSALNVVNTLQLGDADWEVMLCGAVDREQAAQVCRFFPTVSLYQGTTVSRITPEVAALFLHQYAVVL